MLPYKYYKSNMTTKKEKQAMLKAIAEYRKYEKRFGNAFITEEGRNSEECDILFEYLIASADEIINIIEERFYLEEMNS